MKVKRLIALPSIVAFCNASTIEDLRAELLDLNEQAETIQATADGEKRDLTEEEADLLDKIFASFERTEADIERRKRIAKQSAKLSEGLGPKAEKTPVGPAKPALKPVSPSYNVNPEEKGRWGWRSFGEYSAAVKTASHHGGGVDPRLVANAPTTYSTEGVGADGGFAVPPDFRTEIMVKVAGEESLLGRTDQLLTSSNTLTLPKDETTPWQTSGGIQAYWEGEGKQISQSKVSLESSVVKLNKLTVLVPVTEELLEDSPALDSYLRRKTPQKMDFKVTDAIVNGNGVGKPMGLLDSACTISVAKESGQAADTVVFANIIKMWARMYGPSRKNAVWLINQDIEPQLFQMSFEGTSSSVPAYMPAGGLSSSPYSTLMGRPIIPTQAMQTLGDKGDIALVDLSEYITAMKTAGVRQDISIHLWFDYDMTAFRFILRLAGQPWWSSTISPKNGSNTLSPFVTLAERGA